MGLVLPMFFYFSIRYKATWMISKSLLFGLGDFSTPWTTLLHGIHLSGFSPSTTGINSGGAAVCDLDQKKAREQSPRAFSMNEIERTTARLPDAWILCRLPWLSRYRCRSALAWERYSWTVRNRSFDIPIYRRYPKSQSHWGLP